MSLFKKSFLFVILFFSGVIFVSLYSKAEYALPQLGLGPQVTVSGVSSGAFMAVQMQVTHSAIIRGVGTFAGGVYGCAEGDFRKAKECMENPQSLSTQKFIDIALELESQNQIDPLSNLKDIPIFIFSGNRDSVVRIEASFRLEEFFKHWGAQTRINTSVPAEHGFPTKDFGNNCDVKALPWLQNCGVDGAQILFEGLQIPLQPRTQARPANLQEFDQRPYRTKGDGLAETGAIYIPTACRDLRNPQCQLHVAFHGCHMSPEFVNQDFIEKSGLNDWAESNHIVVLYPAVKKSETNPGGCWDWFGYTGKEYLTREAKQIKAVTAMITRLSAE